MPQRQQSDPFVTRAGLRFHELRKEHGFSLQDLTQGAKGGSKGYISQFERGMALPTLVTLDRIARLMGLDIVDFVNFAERGLRNQLIEMTRGLGERELKQLLAQAAAFSVQRTLPTRHAAERLDPGGRSSHDPTNTARRKNRSP